MARKGDAEPSTSLKRGQRSRPCGFTWLKRMPHATCTSEPATHCGSGPLVGGSHEPISPILEKFVAKKTESPPMGVCENLPPAWPHGSTTGAAPGALHGLKR